MRRTYFVSTQILSSDTTKTAGRVQTAAVMECMESSGYRFNSLTLFELAYKVISMKPTMMASIDELEETFNGNQDDCNK